MTQPTISMTFSDLYTEVADYLGYGRSPAGDQLAEVKRYANEGYQQFLMGRDDRTGRAYAWSFLEPQATLVLWTSISAGTTTVSGTVSSGSTVLTATAASFHASMIGHNITITDIGTFTITAYTSATVITVSGDATCTTKSFAIASDSRYTLPDDFAHLADDFTFAPAGSIRRMSQRSAAWLRNAEAASNATGYPVHYAVQPREFSESIGQRWEVLVWPQPSTDHTVYYRYRVNPNKLVNDGDYPIGGAIHSQTVLACCLAVAESRKNDGQSYHRDLTATLLQTSIDIDSRNKPRTLGYNADGPSGPSIDRRGNVTY